MPFAQMEISIEEFFCPNFTISRADSYNTPTTGMNIYCSLSKACSTLYSELLLSVIVSNDCQMS